MIFSLLSEEERQRGEEGGLPLIFSLLSGGTTARLGGLPLIFSLLSEEERQRG